MEIAHAHDQSPQSVWLGHVDAGPFYTHFFAATLYGGLGESCDGGYRAHLQQDVLYT
jgi:hypothetical protein